MSLRLHFDSWTARGGDFTVLRTRIVVYILPVYTNAKCHMGFSTLGRTKLDFNK